MPGQKHYKVFFQKVFYEIESEKYSPRLTFAEAVKESKRLSATYINDPAWTDMSDDNPSMEPETCWHSDSEGYVTIHVIWVGREKK